MSAGIMFFVANAVVPVRGQSSSARTPPSGRGDPKLRPMPDWQPVPTASSRDQYLPAPEQARASFLTSGRPSTLATPRDGRLTPRATPRSEPTAELRAHPLCPSLVVPENCECTLVMSRLKPGFFSDGSRVEVRDPDNKPVMQLTSVAASGDSDGGRLALSDPSGELLAYCQDGNGSVLLICSLSGIFATFRQTGAGFEITGCRPWTLQVVEQQYTGSGRGLALVGGDGSLLAIRESSGQTPTDLVVRVNTHVDVGLVLLSFLCADVMEVAS
mmetsp:Transcript_158024/g.484298  ORF Transcript_158024/g.484298 Transcript_158024/m.484298 type:complete len:272 (+) Transcript_158024:196-1011(+)